ncbi:MAG: L,D-transpeptidase [Firmicutes bacterium]|nr:L,D-transpeptidase [Bacillota bacterium]
MDNNDKLQNEYENIEDASPIFFDDIHEEDEAPAHSAERDLSEAPASPSVDTANDAFVLPAEGKISNEAPTQPSDEKNPKAAKKKNPGRTAYLIFVLFLVLAIAGGLFWVWKQCAEYQKASAATLVGEAGKELSEATGLELESSLIPTVNDAGEYEYVLKSEGKPVAKVTLEKTKSGIMGLALFEKKDVQSLVKYKVIMPEDCVLSVTNQTIDYMSTAEDYVFPATQKLKKSGFSVETYKKIDVNWVYDESQLEVSRNGEVLPLIQLDKDTFFAANYYKDYERQTIRERAAELSNKYALFMSNDYSYWDLDPYIIPGSPLKDVLSGMDMTWFGYHYYTEVKDLVMSEPINVGDRYAMINLSFNYDVIRWDGTDRSPIELCLILHLEDDGYWRLADLENNIQVEQDMSSQAAWINPYSMPNGNYPYQIRVNRSLNCVTVYTQDDYGEYTVPVKAMICSTGREGHETPVDTYNMEWRADWCYMVDGSWGRYAINLRYDGYMFHTICYYSNSVDNIMRDEYNLLGDYASLGCIRLQTIDCKWLYDNCVDGTQVIVYEDPSSPGPLGKPARAVDFISETDDCGWDPTDPRPDNPWRNR